MHAFFPHNLPFFSFFYGFREFFWSSLFFWSRVLFLIADFKP